jgi:hypothetical protein
MPLARPVLTVRADFVREKNQPDKSMKLYKTACYRIKPESQSSVERAMQVYAAYLKREFPAQRWWTARSQTDPLSYISVIAAPDEKINRAASDSDGTGVFVDALYPNVVGEVEWTDWQPVASTHPLQE